MLKFKITENQKQWAIRASRKKYKKNRQFWEDLIQKQNGRCALTKAPLLFDKKNGTPQKSDKGCHPLYASVDHINPGRTDHGFGIVCYDINDLKAHLPLPLFNALKQTKEWNRFIKKWKKTAESSENRHILKKLIEEGG